MKQANSISPKSEPVSERTLLQPLVSIGIPVFNAENTISACIESALAQNYTNFEILISDNASTDSTAEICKKYQKNDSRIRYFKQNQNIGGLSNFNFVLEASKGSYFRWLAADDLISSNSLAESVKSIGRKADFVACTAPTFFDYEYINGQNPIVFGLEGSQYSRIQNFFRQPGRSHGLFYSLIKRDVLIEFPFITHDFFAWDWCLVLFLLSKGPFASANSAFLILGSKGVSSTNAIYGLLGLTGLKRVLPFWQFNIKTINSGINWTSKSKLLLLIKLVSFNSKNLLKELRIVRYKLSKIRILVMDILNKH
jgi:glycosyltransferase involved in cell wall biosynthesis